MEVLKMKRFIKVLKAIGNGILFALAGKGEIADEAIREGIISYEGQGRDEFGK
jgi:hypothetical protein